VLCTSRLGGLDYRCSLTAFWEEAPGGGDGVRLVCKWAERGSMTLNVIRLAIEVGLFLLETVNLYLRFKR